MRAKLHDRGRFRVSGDCTLLVEYGTDVDLAVNEKVRAMAELIRTHAPEGVKTIVPSYRTLSVAYDPLQISPQEVRERLWELEGLWGRAELPAPRTVEIPVCYGGSFGPDIQFVADYHQLSVDEVVRIHSGVAYHIYAVGFAPGFCYLGGLDERLHTPRLETPRTLVPGGSVGIAEIQTGVYPSASPGGWRLIGRTPLQLFAPHRSDPFLYKAGDKIRFKPISREEFSLLSQHEGS